MPQFAIDIQAETDDLLKAPIDFAGGSSTVIVGISGFNIRVYKLFLVTSGPTTLTFQDGGNTLAAMPFSTNQGMVWDFDTKPWFTLTSGNNFIITSSNAVQVSGRVYFTDGLLPGALIGLLLEGGIANLLLEDAISDILLESGGPLPPTSGKLFSWGYNKNGEMGIGVAGNYGSPFYAYSSPVQVGALTTWTSVGCGYSQALGERTDGTLWAWGLNSLAFGALGLGDTINRSSPTQVGALTTWGRVTSGSDAGSTGLINGQAFNWGQVLQGANVNQYFSSPILVGARTDWTDLETHAQFFHGIIGGKLYSWGENDWGNCALGYTSPLGKFISSPTQVGALTNWSKLIKGHGVFSLFLKTDGTLWAVGKGGQGQLGDGTHVNLQASPVLVSGGHTWSSTVVSGKYHSLAVDTNGYLWVWGSNFYGDLGLGTNGLAGYVSAPVQLGTNKWVSVAAGNHFSLAVRADGTLWAWGRNNYGALGLGDTANRSSPTQVGTLNTWISCFAMHYVGFGIRA